MSTPDQRLRERLDRATASVEPDIDRHLRQSLTRGRRRQVVRRVGIAAGTLAAVALVTLAGQRVLDRSSDRIPARTPTPSVSPASLALDGTWSTQATRADVEAALAAGGLETWTDQLIDELGGGTAPLDIELRIDGDSYTVSVDGQLINEGTVQTRDTEIVLGVAPNGVTILDATADGDVLALAFVSNSTQPYPPDMVPEEALQRTLYASATFERT